MKDILVTALVSTYNSEKFIRGCLEDLVSQSLYQKNLLEIIVIDANSQQNEQKIVEEYRRKYPNISYIRTAQRIPLYAAWNVGIKQARGKYLTNANTDDRHHPLALEFLANELEKFPEIALVYPDQITTTLENQTFENFTPSGFAVYPEFDRQYLLNYTFFGHQPMWRASLHKEFGLFSETLRVAGDYEWWLRITEKYDCKHIPLLLGLYYYNPSGLERENTQLCLTETFQVRKFYQERANKPSLENFYPQVTYFKYYIDFTKPLSELPEVSVILFSSETTRNLVQIINSILNQTFKNLEVIVVWKSKNDNNKLSDFFYDKRVKFLNITNNLSLYELIKLGLNNSKGKYILFLSDTTKLFPRHLEFQLSILQPNPQISFALTSFLKVFQDNKTEPYIELKREAVPPHKVINQLKNLNNKFLFFGSIFRKEALTEKNIELLLEPSEETFQKMSYFLIPQITWEFIIADEEEEPTKQIIRDESTSFRDYPLVSVVIPCFNYAHLLHEAVESIVNQTFKDWECIIVNDGSPDNTQEVANYLIKKFPDRRILYYEKNNEGVAEARNFGISKARGKYILTLDADDLIAPTYMEKAVKILEENKEISFVYADVQHFGNENRVYPSFEWNSILETRTNYISSATFFRKEVWVKTGGFKKGIGYEDWEFWINAIEKGFQGKRIPEIGHYYRTHNQSRFRDDMTQDNINKAKIILLHPIFYDKSQLLWARYILEGKNPPGEFENKLCYMPVAKKLSIKVPTENKIIKEQDEKIVDLSSCEPTKTHVLTSQKLKEESNPENKNYDNRTVEDLIADSKYDEAEDYILKFINSNSDILSALNDLAIVSFLKGKKEEAIQLFKTVLLIDKENIFAKENLEQILSEGN